MNASQENSQTADLRDRTSSGTAGVFFKRIWEYLNGTGEKDRPALPGRNDLCWCGSGLKYKRCHIEEDEKKRRKRTGTRI